MSSLGVRSRTLEDGWPCQRLRLAFGLILFFFFELFIGRQLPFALAVIALGIGVASFVSAMRAINEWKLTARLTAVMQALEQGT